MAGTTDKVWSDLKKAGRVRWGRRGYMSRRRRIELNQNVGKQGRMDGRGS